MGCFDMKRKFLGLLLCLTLMLLAAVPVRALEADAEEEIRQRIIEGYRNLAESVDLAEYRLSAEDAAEIYFDLYNSGRLPWYAEWEFGYSYYTHLSYIMSLELKYLPEKQYDRNLYEQTVAEVLDATVYPGMEDWQMALSVHDYLIVNSTYDDSITKYRGYDLLVNGTAVCQGYAEAYMDLMNRVGIECVIVESEAMEHAWNLVRLDGNWYHVDLTWDDPSYEGGDMVSHDFFLLSDQQIRTGRDRHYGWQTDIQCGSTAEFGGRFWEDASDQICYTDGDTCYLRVMDEDQTHIYRRTESTGEQKEIYAAENPFLNIGRGKYYYFHTGFSLWNDRIYFNTLAQIRSMAPDGSDVTTVYSHEDNRSFLSCSYVRDGVLHITASDHDGNVTDRIELPLDQTAGHEHTWTAGTVTAPTCRSIGTTAYACDCGLTFTGDLVMMTEHTFDQGTAVRGSAGASGSKIEYTCTVCGYQYTETTRIPGSQDTQTQSGKRDFWGWVGGIGIIAAICLTVFIVNKKRYYW